MKFMEVRKRGWVKNAAIVFLAVMLVLTFFSNTIKNRSLPEVAAQYTQSGTITARIRGSGNVTANESFVVKTAQTREVSEVPVKLGDMVEVGDVLVRLSGSVSGELQQAQDALRTAERVLEEAIIRSVLVGSIADSELAVQSAKNNLAEAQREASSIGFDQSAYNSAQSALVHADSALSKAQETLRSKNLDVQFAALDLREINPEEDPKGYAKAEKKLADAERAQLLAQSAVDAASDVQQAAGRDAAAQESLSSLWESAQRSVSAAQESLNNANFMLAQAQRSAGVDSSVNELDLRDFRKDVEEKQKLVESLEKDGVSSEITALVNGKVSQIMVHSGEQAMADETLMVIEVVDRGYSLTIQVSTEQANRVSVGDQAEVDRGWFSWGEELKATLINIRNDPTNPVMGRILHFNITGDVESGDQLNVTLAQRSENYSIVVPNSAIRSDTNGDFVLVVISRNSPLGNRFIATRADVNILAADDTSTAVSGGLSGWDFVITYSQRPIDPGMEVRLVDNP